VFSFQKRHLREARKISAKYVDPLKSEIMARRSMKFKIRNIIFKTKLRFALFILILLAVCLFIVAALLNAKGTFTITLPRSQMIDFGLVISDTPDFKRPRHEILSPPVLEMDAISESSLPPGLDMLDGSNNGDDYLAMTVYLKNTGSRDLKYRLYLELNEVYKEADEALRIKLYVNDDETRFSETVEPTVYAKRNKTTGEPERNEGGEFVGIAKTPFAGNRTIIALDPVNLDSKEVHKFTVIAWIEGDDPECKNEILGGFVRMTLRFDAELNKEEKPV